MAASITLVSSSGFHWSPKRAKTTMEVSGPSALPAVRSADRRVYSFERRPLSIESPKSASSGAARPWSPGHCGGASRRVAELARRQAAAADVPSVEATAALLCCLFEF